MHLSHCAIVWLIHFAGLVTCLLAGNPNYDVTYDSSTTEYSVWTDGYYERATPVVKGQDIPSRTHARSRPRGQQGHMAPSQLASLQVTGVINEETVAAAQVAMAEKDSDPLTITENDTEAWTAMVDSPFGKLAVRVANAAGKSISSIAMERFFSFVAVQHIKFNYA
ncbi:hypothetical protein Cob_v007529 [Colletotrichum orbiculare MAFF 240422]|uniref:Uncharacterized protein n=1 Tax=Colletotrichum orbiculare (strain 104-T / ATCC 96160 / CBS 514.97 / LARS 414 / MAFF 240422) TaxID=1213857 RepID=A0A484FNP2_COLOR|nr:hypothetical protein Cob_v007529 [Colletotrichum orbiculare MAFF 240422]